jgi:uncharacterized surface protein with fasciclin (FAS1) repeats
MAFVEIYDRVSDVTADLRNLSTFNQLLRRSGVATEIGDAGPYTLLAPTNGAFDRLPDRTIGDLVKAGRRLHDTMAYHVVKGAYPEETVREMRVLRTLFGAPVSVVVTEDGGVYVGASLLIDPDIQAGNGIVHIVDSVLFP